MSVNVVKGTIRKFEETGSLGVAPGKVRCAASLRLWRKIKLQQLKHLQGFQMLLTVNSSSTEHSVDNNVHTFKENFKALLLQESFRAEVTARSFCTSFCDAFFSEDASG